MKRILTIVLPVVMLPVLASEVYESEIGSILQAVSSTNRCFGVYKWSADIGVVCYQRDKVGMKVKKKDREGSDP